MLNYVGTDDARCRYDMDRLRVDVNRIRVAARDFEAALKAAGLMKSLLPTNALPAQGRLVEVN